MKKRERPARENPPERTRRLRPPPGITPPLPNVDRTAPSGMPLPNAKQEQFAQFVASRSFDTLGAAYAAAGFKGASAARLMADPRIAGRIAKLQSIGAERAVVTIESLVAELEEAREMGRKLGQTATMVAATREKAVLLGLRIEKRDTTTRAGDPKGLTDDELAVIARGSGDGTAAPPSDAGRPDKLVH